jgi:DNA-directed RNA polymerase specialized sigma24 family protein
MDEVAHGVFPPTHWSMVLSAGDDHSPASAEALERLCGLYREPVRRFLIGSGIPVSETEDIVQSFFMSLLRRKSFSRVAPERGRFRTYLKRCLRNHLLDRPRPLPPGFRIELDGLEESERDAVEPGTVEHPGHALDREWAEHVLHLAYLRLEERHSPETDPAFRHLRRFLAEEPGPGDYAAVAAETALAANTVAKRVQRLREELDDCVREILLETVGTPSEVEAEIRALFS